MFSLTGVRRSVNWLGLALLLLFAQAGCALDLGSAASPAGDTPPPAQFIPSPDIALPEASPVETASSATPAAATSTATFPDLEGGDDLRGVWIQARAITTRKKIDRMLDDAQAAGFNAVFIGTFFKGQTLYDSRLAPKSSEVDPDFNPLAYLMEGARQRGLKVHAWFAVGDLDSGGGESILLEQHPDWALLGPEGNPTTWLNFNHPEVRRFLLDLTQEVITNYGVDGIHLDYMRYPGSEWGYDRYTAGLLQAATGLDLDVLRYAGLPAYGSVKSNPLVEPVSARVLASFSNGVPAVTLNRYGEGEVVVLNWAASRRTFAAGGEILRRSLERLRQDGGEVALLRAEENLQVYGEAGLRQAGEWLSFLGYTPVETTEEDIDRLDPASVLVVPNVYLISKETAKDMAEFVQAGGGMVFIDGPTRSIHRRDLQAITGMGARGKHFVASVLLTAPEAHPLLPPLGADESLTFYEQRDERWKEFRRSMLTSLVGEMDAAIHALSPDVEFTITITADQEDALQEDLQDWQAWMNKGWVDRLIPRAYVDELPDLQPILRDWRPAIRDYPARVTLAVIVLQDQDGERNPKPPGQLLSELEVIRSSGSAGWMVFNLNQMDEAQVEAVGRYFERGGSD